METETININNLPLEPPFLDEDGKYNHKRARAWQRMKLRPRIFFRSKYQINPPKDKQKIEGESFWQSAVYVKPKTDMRLKGKMNIKAAKRAKVRAMKAAQNKV